MQMKIKNIEILLQIKAYEKSFINDFIKNLQKNLTEKLQNNFSIKIIGMPTRKTLFTVLRSPHIDKEARDQFEMRTFKKSIVLQIPINFFTIIQIIQQIKTQFSGIEIKLCLKKNATISK